MYRLQLGNVFNTWRSWLIWYIIIINVSEAIRHFLANLCSLSSIKPIIRGWNRFQNFCYGSLCGRMIITSCWKLTLNLNYPKMNNLNFAFSHLIGLYKMLSSIYSGGVAFRNSHGKFWGEDCWVQSFLRFTKNSCFSWSVNLRNVLRQLIENSQTVEEKRCLYLFKFFILYLNILLSAASWFAVIIWESQ